MSYLMPLRSTFSIMSKGVIPMRTVKKVVSLSPLYSTGVFQKSGISPLV